MKMRFQPKKNITTFELAKVLASVVLTADDSYLKDEGIDLSHWQPEDPSAVQPDNKGSAYDRAMKGL